MIYNYGYNPFGLRNQWGAGVMESDHFATFNQRINTSDEDYQCPFGSIQRFPLSSLDAFNTLRITGESIDPSSTIGLTFKFDNKARPLSIASKSFYASGGLQTVDLTITSSNKKNYANYVSSYGLPYIWILFYRSIGYGSEEQNSVSYGSANCYKIEMV